MKDHPHKHVDLNIIKRNERITKHVKTNTERRYLKCGYCKKAFNQIFQYKKHLRSHMKVYKCEYCKEAFSYITDKNEHLNIHHKGDLKCLKNEQLNERLKKSINRNNNFVNDLELTNIDEKIPIEEMDKLKSEDDFSNYNNSIPFICEFCESKFTDSSEYIRHMSQHVVLNHFSCVLCGDKFNEDSDIDSHLCAQKAVKIEPPDIEYDINQIVAVQYQGEAQQHELDSKYNLQKILLNDNHDNVDTDIVQIHSSSFVDTSNVEYDENINKCELCGELFCTLYDYKLHLKMHNVFVDNDHNYTIEVSEQEEAEITSNDNEISLKSGYELVLVEGTDTYVLTRVKDTIQDTSADLRTDRGNEIFDNNQECNSYLEIPQNNIMHEDSIENIACVCAICGQHFENMHNLELHMTTHSHIQGHKCEICDRDFRRHSDLKRHMIIHTGERPYSCEICGQTFTRSAAKDKHMQIHANEHIAILSVCDLCGESFDEIEELKVHIQEHTGEAIKCEFCEERITDLYDYKAHMQTHVFEELFVCSVCHKTFTSDEDYNKHMEKHQPTRNVLCMICGKTFRSTHNLKIHMRIHTMSRPYKCEVCGKTFTQTSSHSIHMRIHTGERPYKCEICGKSFSQTGHHKTHMRIHTGLRPFQCELCSKTFSDYGNYIKHTRLHTGDQPYKCIECNKGFSRKKRYELHMLTHEN